MNSSNDTYYPLEYWFELFGYPVSVEIISTFLVLPFGLISFLLNLISFIVLTKQCFLGSIFYSYMKLYIINGAILSLISSTQFIAGTHKMFSFTNSYGALAYTIYFFISTQATFFLFTCFLEICIVIERSMYFLPKRFRKIQNIDFNKLTLILFLFCIMLHLPTLFFSVPAYLDIQSDKNIPYRI